MLVQSYISHKCIVGDFMHLSEGVSNKFCLGEIPEATIFTYACCK